MNQSIARIGDNLPPNDAELLPETLKERHRQLLDGAERLVEAAERLPETIADERHAAGKMGRLHQKRSAAAGRTWKAPAWWPRRSLI